MDPALLAAAPLLVLLVLASLVLLTTRTLRDPVTLLTLYLVLLFGIRARLVIAPLGAVGSPALLFGLALAGVWVCAKLMPATELDRGVQPMRLALFTYGGIMLLSSAAAHLRPLTDLEQSGANRALIGLVAAVGVALLVCDGVSDRARLDTLLRRLVYAATFMAAVGVVQFLTGWDPMQHVQIPGLTANHELVAIGERSDFNRPWGTATHAIEFSVVLAALLPLSLHFALTDEKKWEKRLHWAFTVLIAMAVAMSLSRSGVVTIAVALVVLAWAWHPRRLLNVAVAIVAFTAVMWAAIPGLVGTIHSMFTNVDVDPSIVARRERVPVVFEYIREYPFLGHGFGTFSVEEYLLVDNELYTTAIQTGWIGLATVVALILCGCALGVLIRTRTSDYRMRHLGQALAAGLAGMGVALYTFDAFGFRIYTGVLFFLLGAVGALWRVSAEHAPSPEPRATSPGEATTVAANSPVFG